MNSLNCMARETHISSCVSSAYIFGTIYITTQACHLWLGSDWVWATAFTPVIWTRLEWEVRLHLHMWSGPDLNQKFDFIYTMLSGVDLNQKFDIFYTCDLDQTWVRCLTSSTPVIWTRLESEVLHHLHLWSGSDLNQKFDIIDTCDLGQMWIKHLTSFTLMICTRHESDIYCHVHQWPGPDLNVWYRLISLKTTHLSAVRFTDLALPEFSKP